MKIKNKKFAGMLAVLMTGTFLMSNCKKEEAVEPMTSSEASMPALNDSVRVEKEATSAPSSTAYKIESALPKGYVKDGTVDYTSYVQAAIKKYKELVFPGFPILVNDAGLTIPSDRKITFLSGSKILLKPTTSSKYKILYILNASNVTLINPVIVGDREKHLGTTGEDGVGITIAGSSKVNIVNPKVSYTWGDGIYIGRNSIKSKSTDITISKAEIYKAGRNGITIASAENVKISDPVIKYTDRIDPMAGIDIEPNSTKDDLKNIVITNPVTYKNGWTGVQVGLSQYYYDNEFSKKEISIEVINHKDEGSVKNGVWLSTAGKGTSKDMGTIVSGTLKFTTPTWIGNQLPIKGATLKEPSLTLTLERPTVIDAGGNTYSKSQMEALLKKNIGAVTKSISY